MVPPEPLQRAITRGAVVGAVLALMLLLSVCWPMARVDSHEKMNDGQRTDRNTSFGQWHALDFPAPVCGAFIVVRLSPLSEIAVVLVGA